MTNQNFNLNREPVIINTHGDIAYQIDNTGGHQAYLNYKKSIELNPENIKNLNKIKLWDEK